MKTPTLFSLIFLAGTDYTQNQFTNFGNLKIHTTATVSVFGNLINNGSLSDSGAVLNLAGTSAQQIGGSSITTFSNLTLNNSAGAYLGSNEKLKGVLTISAGTFSTTGYDFTLISNANGTARIAPILGDFSGNITMQRYLGTGSTGWRFLATPVSGVTINDWQDNFITSGFPGSSYPSFPFVSIYSYDESATGSSDYGYTAPTSSSDVLSPGKGYWCYIGPVPLTVDVTGPPAKFAQTFSVTYTPSGGSAEDGFVMLGNPYPSTIDWSAAGWTRSNVNNAIYIWNPDLQQYASWVGGTATNGGSNLIASSQAFWVQANAAGPSLSCTENVKVSSDRSFIRPVAPLDIKQLKLSISGNNYSDETILRFGGTAHKAYDAELDARKLFSSNDQVPGIASQDSSLNDLSINSLPGITSSMHIPVKTKVGVTGVYTIKRDSVYGLPLDYCVVLEDLLSGTKTNLASTSSYTFFIGDTTQAARFVLHVSASGYTESISTSCSGTHNGKAIAGGLGTGPWNYSWFSANNVPLKQSTNMYGADSLKNLAAGLYYVQISDQNGLCGSFTKSISVGEPLPVIASFTMDKDSLYAGLTDGVQLMNTSNNAQTYTWYFGDGSDVETGERPSVHYYSKEGTYVISLVARYTTCTDSVFKSLVVRSQNLSGVSEQIGDLTQLSIFPNPGNGHFYLNAGKLNSSEAEIEIRSASGQLVFKAPVNSGLQELDLSGHAQGIYFYNIRVSGSMINHGKIILE